MQVLTLKEAARRAKIGAETLKRACEEGRVKATKLPSRSWIIAESALEEALHNGLDLGGLTKKKSKGQQPAGLKKWQDEHPGGNRKNKKQNQ